MRRRNATIAIALMIACLPAVPAGASEPVWQLQQQAGQAADIGKLDKADRILAKARRRAPGNPYVAFDHAGVLARKGEISAALAALEVAVGHGFRGESLLRESEALESLRGTESWETLIAAARANEVDFRHRLEEARRPLDPADGTEFADIATLLDAKEQADRDFYRQESDEPRQIGRARFEERWVASLLRLARQTEDRTQREEALISVVRERMDGALMLDLYWPGHAVEKVRDAAASYLDAFPRGAHRIEARLAQVLSDTVVSVPDDPHTPRSAWPQPSCAEALPALAELAASEEADDEWTTTARGVEALCLTQVSPERRDEIRDAARAYLERERTFSSYDRMLVGSLKMALWRIEGLPRFEAEGLDGDTVSLDDFRGKITLLDFWSPG